MKTQSVKQKLATDKGIHRDTLIEMGLYNVHKGKVYRDKTKYTRKDKHRKSSGND